MRRTPVIAALGLALMPIACATSQFDQHFEAGRYLEASRIFAEDSALQRREQALFRAGLVYALPASPAYEPTLAQDIFERLLTLYPKSGYRSRVTFLTGLLAEVQRLEQNAAAREAEMRRIRERMLETEERARWLEAMLERQELQTNTFRDLTERLDAELRQAREHLRTLQEELDRLKEIDLKERRRPGQGT